MKYCIFCGASLPDVARFCAKCGNNQDVEETSAPAPAPVRQTKPAPAPAAPVKQSQPAPTTSAVVSKSVPSAPSRPAAKGLRYADMTPVVTSMQDKYYKATGPYTPPPYVLAPEKDDRNMFVMNHPHDVTSVINARLTDLPNGSYNSNASLDVCSDYLRITVMNSLLLMMQWEWVALTFDSIRKITTSMDGRRECATIEFVNQECHPLTVSSKSKHFSELISRVASYAGITITRG